MICPNCNQGKFPQMEIRHNGIYILVCTQCGWKGEVTRYSEELFGKWEVLNAQTIDEAAGIPYWDAKWAPGQPPPANRRNPYKAPNFTFSDTEKERLDKLRKELWDEFRRKYEIDLS